MTGTLRVANATGTFSNLHVAGDSVDTCLRIGNVGEISSGTNTFRLYTKPDDKAYITRGGFDTRGIVIDNIGNVGIGTTNPLFKTQIRGTGQTVADITDAGNRGDFLSITADGTAAGSGGALIFGNSQSDVANSLGMAGIKGFLTNGSINTVGDLVFLTRSSTSATSLSERWRIISTGILQAASAQTIRTSTGNLTLATAGGNGHIILSPHGTGKVGIGTTSPTALLEVVTSSQTGSTAMLILSRSSGYGRTLFEQTYDSTYFTAGKTLTLKNDSNTAFIHFAGNNTGTQTNVLIPNGNVGIGTTSPATALEIVNATAPQLRLRDGVSGGILNFQSNGSGQTRITWGGNGAISGEGGNFNVDSSGTNLVFRTLIGSAERMRITSAGNVGIGTTTPSQKLDVQGNIAITKALLSNQENLDVDLGATRVIATISSTLYDAAFFDFVIKKGTNRRAGTVYVTHNGTSVEFTETSTNDLGTTSDVTLSVDLSGGNIRLLATTLSNDWIIKTLIRGL